MRRYVLLACLLSFLVVIAGCRLSRAVGRSTSALFESQRKVTKVQNPKRDARLSVIWVGHATALVQMDDKFILTDPVFTGTVGEVSRRIVEPGIDVDRLPPLDAVMISHLHFDHLSLGSLDAIENKVRMLLMPPGGVTYLTDFGFPVLELRRWQAWEKDGLRVTAVPVDHVGFRYGIDDAWMKESFTGYVVEYHGLKVYFGGDSAYDPKNSIEIGQKFPRLDLALVPIAPIEPRALMRRFHMDPAEAVQTFFDLGAKTMVPIHYDTFVNSTDEPGDALRELHVAEKRYALGGRKIVPLAIGESRIFTPKDGKPASEEPPLDTPPPAAKPTSTTPPPAPKPTSDIPDDERLD